MSEELIIGQTGGKSSAIQPPIPDPWAMQAPELETCDKCGKDWVKSPVQMRGLASPTTRHPSLGDDRLKHFCDRVCLMRYLLTPEEMKTLRGDKGK